MFKVGDMVVHPIQGVGVIQKLLSIPEFSTKLKYYQIRILSGKYDTTVMVPVKRAKQLGLRHAISEDDLTQVWDVLDSNPQTLPNNYRKRYKVLQDKLKQHGPLPKAEVVRDLAWRRRITGKLNAPAQRLYDNALDLLASEMAASEEVEPQTAKQHIKHHLNDRFANLPTDDV